MTTTFTIVAPYVGLVLSWLSSFVSPYCDLNFKSISLLEITIKAYSCEIDCIIGVVFIMTFGGANKFALRRIKSLA